MTLPRDVLEVQIRQLGGSSAWFKVWPRDISRTGLGFIHGAFVHPGVACALSLVTLGGAKAMVQAKVARCEHIKGRAHFVGVRFDEPLPLHEYVPGVAAPDKPEKDSKPGAASPMHLKSLVGQLVSLSAAKDCPPQIRKVAKQLAEAVAGG